MRLMIKLKYPNDFLDCDRAVKINDEEIQGYIDDVLGKLLQDTNEVNSFHFIGSGNVMVFGFSFDYANDISIFVCKDYYDAEIWKENGKYTKLNLDIPQIDDIRRKLEQYSKDDLINMIIDGGKYDKK